MGNCFRSSENNVEQLPLKKEFNWSYLVKRGTYEQVSAISCSQNGEFIAIAWNHVIKIFSAENGQEVGETLPNHWTLITSIRLSQDDSLLFVACLDGQIKIWDMNSRKEIGDSNSRYMANIKTILLSKYYIAAQCWQQSLFIFKINDRYTPLIKKLEIEAFDFAPNNRQILFSHLAWPSIFLQDILTRKSLHYYVRKYRALICVNCSPKGKTIAIIAGSIIKIIDYQRNKLITQFQGLIGETLAFSPSGQQLLAGSRKGKIYVCDILSRKCTHLLGHEGEVCQVGFSPDGRCVFSLDSVQLVARFQKIE